MIRHPRQWVQEVNRPWEQTEMSLKPAINWQGDLSEYSKIPEVQILTIINGSYNQED